MKKNLLILSAILTIHLLYSQEKIKDSLENLLRTARDDSARIAILGRLTWINTWSNPEHALELAKQQ